ncbi:large-conductance mechanosensitive channel protein MscL [Tunicatimonas pelagia]|uniref:large-conductance mechanosensitive channel protein MscL n=1 Tax=Tunicatimonas pelagia TaxID=931531 RepID=UPI002665048D|nr:large-conductance mechanosensitive channel protein MscL [Tunicatimonas pelagia]WKN44519.1 large-conductance mechanosensitive channel protein MscL [Tunicatimonas pelagia]
MNKFIQNFKEFAVKGNVVDLAVGIIIGAAFNKIVSTLVEKVIMPPFGLLFGNAHFNQYEWILRPRELNPNGDVIQEQVAIGYGALVQVTFDFLIIALSIFVVIRLINSLKRKAEDENEKSVPTPKDIQLLAEIRDLMKKQAAVE